MAQALFNISLVILLVQARLNGMDRTHVEASFDLYGTPWRTFWQITFPQLLPAIVAGFLLSFTFSFDDYVITTFVSGAGTTTLPLYIFGSIRKGVTPATNAVAAVMLLITLSILLIGQWLVSRNSRRGRPRAGLDDHESRRAARPYRSPPHRPRAASADAGVEHARPSPSARRPDARPRCPSGPVRPADATGQREEPSSRMRVDGGGHTASVVAR